MRNIFIRALLMILFSVLCICNTPTTAKAVDFVVTTPWLFDIASFIVGGKSQVRCLSNWNTGGEVIIKGAPKYNEVVIALNSKEASHFRLNNHKELNILYESLIIPEHQLRSLFYDPAVIPLIAQNVMKVIANKDSTNYVYYQRRLAELQARIESANDVGKHMLKNKKILDLTASQGVWIYSVSQDTIRPPEDVWNKWLTGDTKSLKVALTEAKRRNWTVIIDPWTSAVIKSLVLDFDNAVLLPTPSKEESYFSHLNSIYLSIWNKTKKTSEPAEK